MVKRYKNCILNFRSCHFSTMNYDKHETNPIYDLQLKNNENYQKIIVICKYIHCNLESAFIYLISAFSISICTNFDALKLVFPFFVAEKDRFFLSKIFGFLSGSCAAHAHLFKDLLSRPITFLSFSLEQTFTFNIYK